MIATETRSHPPLPCPSCERPWEETLFWFYGSRNRIWPEVPQPRSSRARTKYSRPSSSTPRSCLAAGSVCMSLCYGPGWERNEGLKEHDPLLRAFPCCLWRGHCRKTALAWGPRYSPITSLYLLTPTLYVPPRRLSFKIKGKIRKGQTMKNLRNSSPPNQY